MPQMSPLLWLNLFFFILFLFFFLMIILSYFEMISSFNMFNKLIFVNNLSAMKISW